MFILVMQFFWLYIDDLLGKGIPFLTILQLLFYVSMGVIPLAMPLAILLSSIMTFGNLGEHNELTALKSAGLSLFKIIRPLFFLVTIMCISMFFFSNYVIPRANLKWHAIILDIQNTKVASLLKPGKYSTELDGYAIKIEKEINGKMFDITIHDHTDPVIGKTVKARTGEIFKTTNGKFLFFKLENGTIMEELVTTPPQKLTNGQIEENTSNSFRPARRTSFATATYKMNLSGFEMGKSSEDDFTNSQEMLNVFQITTHLDSVRKVNIGTQTGFVNTLKSNHRYFSSLNFVAPAASKQVEDHRADPELNIDPELRNKLVDHLTSTTGNLMSAPKNFTFDTLQNQKKILAYEAAIVMLRAQSTQLQSQNDFNMMQDTNFRSYNIEFHRKFALSVALLVLFFVGAPLGAIVRKGGFGLPVVIAALLFMLYFMLISAGESMANAGTIPCWVGMWSATLVLSPVAAWLMYKAAKDKELIDKDWWLGLFKFKKTKKIT
jgi:lipopolysaccharide export system permease protein